MESDCKYLFVYGSLLNHNNAYAALLKNNSTLVGNGSFTGYLYDLGDYPGAIYQPDSSSRVFGSILLIHNIQEIFPVVDEYEGYGPNESQPNEFIRTIIPIHTAKGMIECHVYLYHLSVTGLLQITSGKYIK
jgi:gamma-glutamylcyclotransferase (GGCT)/AIG2-like uncharacterized protein YtfP